MRVNLYSANLTALGARMRACRNVALVRFESPDQYNRTRLLVNDEQVWPWRDRARIAIGDRVQLEIPSGVLEGMVCAICDKGIVLRPATWAGSWRGLLGGMSGVCMFEASINDDEPVITSISDTPVPWMLYRQIMTLANIVADGPEGVREVARRLLALCEEARHERNR